MVNFSLISEILGRLQFICVMIFFLFFNVFWGKFMFKVCGTWHRTKFYLPEYKLMIPISTEIKKKRTISQYLIVNS